MRPTGRLLGRRALNRALLARQRLLERSDEDAPGLLAHLVGMQAQLPEDPYLGLWSRLRDFDPGSLSGMLADRSAVRIALMRSTIHLVTAEDAARLRPVVRPVLERSLRSNQLRYLQGVDLAVLETRARAIVEERPRSMAELDRELAVRWPGRPRGVLAIAARCSVPLVQVPPRGLWGGRGLPVVTSLEGWLGRGVGPPITIDELAVRYLRAFGPATPGDMRAWSGLAGVREAFERLRPDLRSFRDERGRELLDVPDGLLPDPASPAPVRFLPVYDNALLGHADRSRIVPDDVGSALGTSQENVGSVLVDGFIGARWRLRRERRAVSLRVELLRPIPARQHRDVEREGGRALDLMARDATSRGLEIVPAP